MPYLSAKWKSACSVEEVKPRRGEEDHHDELSVINIPRSVIMLNRDAAGIKV